MSNSSRYINFGIPIDSIGFGCTWDPAIRTFLNKISFWHASPISLCSINSSLQFERQSWMPWISKENKRLCFRLTKSCQVLIWAQSQLECKNKMKDIWKDKLSQNDSDKKETLARNQHSNRHTQMHSQGTVCAKLWTSKLVWLNS